MEIDINKSICRLLLLTFAAAIAVQYSLPGFAQVVPSSVSWTGTWSVASSVTNDKGFDNQTVRQIVHTSIGGNAARLHFSNVFGTEPIVIRNVRIAKRNAGQRTLAETDRVVTFNGKPDIKIAPGAAVTSDPVAFQVPALADVAISFHLPKRTPPRSTGHIDGLQDAYIAQGDVSADPAFTGGRLLDGQSYYFLTNIDVRNPAASGALVAFGASITDGMASNGNANRRWTNDLALRLSKAGKVVGVLNQGIAGNDFFNNAAGQAGLARFERDALQQANVKWVVISDNAVNDLNNRTPSTSSQLIGAFRQLIRRAHDADVKVICSTLTPFKGTPDWTAAIEVERKTVNAFILHPKSGCDAVLDQAAAVSDPANPAAYLPAYDSGDHLHPNEAGLQAIANALDLKVLHDFSPAKNNTSAR